jgi:hypothetical protein
MLRRPYILAVVCCLLIPVVAIAGAAVSRLIDPELARHTTDYALNYLLLEWAQKGVLMTTAGLAFVLWMACCYLVLRSRKRSLGWLPLAVAGPLGLIVIASLRDRSPEPRDLYQQFLKSLAVWWRALFELAMFILVWFLAYEAVVLKRNLMIQIESFTTGTPISTIIEQQNASSGMYAAGEGMEALYLVAMLYLLRPLLFNLAGRLFVPRPPVTQQDPRDYQV